MGGILDTLGSLWNDVEHAGDFVFHSMEEAISHLAGLGVPAFASLEQFIHFLISMGENPFTFLPHMVNVINSRGGNVVQVLEELAVGFITEGPVPFTQKQLTKVINPVLDGLNQHTQTAHMVASIHQDTITQVQQKLTVLRHGNNGSPGLQGDFALALDKQFASIHTNVTQLITPLGASSVTSTSDPWGEFGDRVGQANQEFERALERVPQWEIAGFVLLDLAVIVVFCVVDVGGLLTTAGIVDVPLVPLETVVFAGLVLLELEILGLWVPFVTWLFQILAAVEVLVKEEVQTVIQNATKPTPNQNQKPKPNPKPDWWRWPDPVPPWLPPDDSDCERDIIQVKTAFPDVRADLIAYLVCLQPKMSAQEVIDLFTLWTSMGMSQQDINAFLDRITHLRLTPGHNQPTREQIIAFLRNHKQDVPDIWQKYSQVQNIPGVDQVLKDMITAPINKDGSVNPTYRGSYFELKWIANRQATVGDVVQVEQFVGGQHGADVVLRNNTFVDTKSYIWKDQTPFFRKIHVIPDLTQQLERYRTDPAFAGRPIIYVFDSDGGTLPADIQKVFDDEKAKGLNVTVQYWPNVNPPSIVP